MGMPTMKPASIRAQCTLLRPKPETRVRVMRWAAPLSARMRPSMAPKPRINTSSPRVSPIPFFRASMVSSRDRPMVSPTKMQTSTKERKALNLATVMSNRSRRTAITAITKGIIQLGR